MTSNNGQRKYPKPKMPRSVIAMYISMMIILLVICVVVFIIMFNNVTGNSGEESKNSGSYQLINPPHSSSKSSESFSESSFESSEETTASSSSEESSSNTSAESSSDGSTVSHSQDFDVSFFDEDLFIGDSIFTGLYLYGYLDQPRVAAGVGYTPYGAVNKVLDDKGMTALDYAEQIQPKRIYILLGSNAMAGSDHSGLEDSYRELVSRIMGACPDTDICCISITPTARKTDYTSIDNEEVRSVNKYIKNMCSELGLTYCDLYSIISDEEGYFLDEYSEIDGMHFVSKTYKVLLSELQRLMS